VTQSWPNLCLSLRPTSGAVSLSFPCLFGTCNVTEPSYPPSPSLPRSEYLLSNRLMSAEVSWPAAEVVQLGIVLSTLGAGLQVGWG